MGSANANTNARELTSELIGAGFESIGFTGSHERWRAPDGLETVALIHHGAGERPKNAFNVRRAIRRSKERAEAATRPAEKVSIAEGVPFRPTEAVEVFPIASAKMRGIAKTPEAAQRSLFTASD